MEKYGGKLIFSGKDDLGEVEVIDLPDIRTLHFGNPVVQSSMYHNDPYAIEMEYNRVMLSSVLFQPLLKQTLFLGLGGAAKAKFLWRNAPECTVEAVELSPLVIDVAQRFFHVPIADERFKIHQIDALDFLRQATPHFYDILFADLYIAAGISPTVSDRDFFQLCERALMPGGILVWNMWSQFEDDVSEHFVTEVGSHFDQLLLLPNWESSNCVVLAFKEPIRPYTYEEIKGNAENWKLKSNLNFPDLVEYLRPYISLPGFDE
jgi:spermidine synthase